MPGMAIRSWPSRKLGVAAVHAPKMVRLARENKRAGAPRAAARAQRTVAGPLAGFVGNASAPRAAGSGRAPMRHAPLAAALAVCRRVAAGRRRSSPPRAGVAGGRRCSTAGASRTAAASRRSRSASRPAGTPTGGCPATPASRRASTGRARRTSPRSPTSGRAPQVFEQLRHDARFGYDGPSGAAGAADARATRRRRSSSTLDLVFGVCDDICMPAEARLAARAARRTPPTGGRAPASRRRSPNGRAAPTRPGSPARPARSAPTAGRLRADRRDHLRRRRPAAEPGRGARGRPAGCSGSARPRAATEGRTVIARAPVEAARRRRPGARAPGAAADACSTPPAPSTSAAATAARRRRACGSDRPSVLGLGGEHQRVALAGCPCRSPACALVSAISRV